MAHEPQPTITNRLLRPLTLATLILLGVATLGTTSWFLHKHFQEKKILHQLEQAENLAQQGDLPTALDAASEIYRKHPSHPEAIRTMARIAARLHLDEARWFWKRLEDTDALTPNDWLARINDLIHRDELREATLQTTAFTQAHPNAPEAALTEGRLHLLRKNPAQAYTALTRAADLDSQSPEIQSTLAQAQAIAPNLNPQQRIEGINTLWSLAKSNQTTSHAIDALWNLPRRTDTESRRLILATLAHPATSQDQKLHALDELIRIDPARRWEVIDHAIQSRTLAKLSPKGQTKFVHWLRSLGAWERMTQYITPKHLEKNAALWEPYLQALLRLQHFDAIEKALALDSCVLSSGHKSFVLAHAAMIKGTDPETIDKRLREARHSAITESRPNLLIEIAGIAKEADLHDRATECYEEALNFSSVRRQAHQGLIDLARNARDTTTLAHRLKAAHRIYHSDGFFHEDTIYTCLLAGIDIELMQTEARTLLATSPEDSRRKLLAAFAHWRTANPAAALKTLENCRINDLTHGERTIAATILASNHKTNAANTLKKTINPNNLLPEESKLIRKITAKVSP